MTNKTYVKMHTGAIIYAIGYDREEGILVKIGVFVPVDQRERMEKMLVTQHKERAAFYFYPYYEVKEVIAQFPKVQQMVDGILFSGYVSYKTVIQANLDIRIPYRYFQLSAEDFYKQLLQIMIENRHFELRHTVIDFSAESEKIQEWIKNLPDNYRPSILTKDENEFGDTVYEEVFQFHLDTIRSKRAQYVFTRFANIIPMLEKANIPYVYFEISPETMQNIVHDLFSQIEHEHLRNNQIVYGYVKVKPSHKQKKRIEELKIHAALLEFQMEQYPQLFVRDALEGFELNTTYETLVSLTNHFNACALLNELVKQRGEIHIGWGVGRTISEAQMNAKNALDYSLHNDFSSTYIQHEEELLGPLLYQEKMLHSNELLKRSEQWQKDDRLTRDQLNKVLYAFSTVDYTKLTSQQFATALNVTVRTANRILKSAVEVNLVRVEEEKGKVGRPANVYYFNAHYLA